MQLRSPRVRVTMVVREDIERDKELLARVREVKAKVPIDTIFIHIEVNDVPSSSAD